MSREFHYFIKNTGLLFFNFKSYLNNFPQGLQFFLKTQLKIPNGMRYKGVTQR